MGVDKSYGSGYKNTGLSKASALKPGRLKKTAPAVAKARALKARNAAAAPSMARDKYSAKTVGALKGVAKGAIKVADYAFNGPKEAQKYSAYGFDSSLALPVGKLIEAARGLRAAGKIGKAAALEARIAAKVGGQIGKRASAIGNAGRGPFSAANFAKENAAIKSITNRDITAAGARAASESLYPKLPNMGYVPGATRTFDRYADPLLEGAGRIFPGIAKRIPKPKLPKGRGGR